MMHHDDDDAEFTPTVLTTPPGGGPLTPLPENEPHAQPIASSLEDLVQQIDDLEATLQYVGSLHPQRDAMRQRLAGLRTLLERW